MDLHLDFGSGVGVRAGLEEALRRAVRDGRLAPGTRLPSSRVLAQDLGVARNTVADAYGQLVAEGWLTARQGSGTRVARGAFAEPAPASAVPVISVSAGFVDYCQRHPYDPRPGLPGLSPFPPEPQ